VTTLIGSDSSYYDDVIEANSDVSTSAVTLTTEAGSQAESTDDSEIPCKARKLLLLFTYKPGDMFPNATATTRACPIKF
jgi:hypothetical protein